MTSHILSLYYIKYDDNKPIIKYLDPQATLNITRSEIAAEIGNNFKYSINQAIIAQSDEFRFKVRDIVSSDNSIYLESLIKSKTSQSSNNIPKQSEPKITIPKHRIGAVMKAACQAKNMKILNKSNNSYSEPESSIKKLSKKNQIRNYNYNNKGSGKKFLKSFMTNRLILQTVDDLRFMCYEHDVTAGKKNKAELIDALTKNMFKNNKASLTKNKLDDLFKLDDLKEMCRQLGLVHSGLLKSTLVDNIYNELCNMDACHWLKKGDRNVSDDLTVDMLKKILRLVGENTNGNKEELIWNLKNYIKKNYK